jgi:hypothetical protein
MIDPVTSIGSVVVVPCFLSVGFGCANASGAISKQPSVTIFFFISPPVVDIFLLTNFLDPPIIQQEPLREFPAAHFPSVLARSGDREQYHWIRAVDER